MLFDQNDTSGKPQLDAAVKILWITLVMTLVNVTFQPAMVEGLFTNLLYVILFIGSFALNALLIHFISRRDKIALYIFIFLFVISTPTYVKYILILRHEITTTMFVNVVIVVLQLVAILMLMGPPGSHQFNKDAPKKNVP